MNTGKKTKNSAQSSQSGFTIIESLLAILVVTILMVGLAPVFALAVATRVQAKRVEIATQATRTYIDGVKSGSIIPPKMISTALKDYAAPSPNPSLRNWPSGYNPAPTPTVPNSQTTDLYCVPGDGHSNCTNDNYKDMIVQAVGQINQSDVITNVTKGYRSYRLGVRVYRADAFKDPNISFTKGSTQSAANGGTGLNKVQAPLVEITTEIAVTDATQFKKLCDAANVTGC